MVAQDRAVKWSSAGERRVREMRRQLIEELANSAKPRARTMNRFHFEELEAFTKARGQLRAIWGPNTPMAKTKLAVDYWLVNSMLTSGARRYKDQPRNSLRISVSMVSARLVADPRDFSIQVALAIAENWQDFGICANRECV